MVGGQMIDDSVLELLRILAWPSLILIGILVFRKSVFRLAEIIPEKIAGTKKLSIGSFSLEIQQRAVSLGTPDLHKSLYRISEKELKYFLASDPSPVLHGVFAQTVRDEPDVDISISYDIEAVRGLINRGLLECTIPFDEVERFIEEQSFKRPYGALRPTYIKREFSEEQIDEISDFDRIAGASIGMTDLGRVAFQAIISTTVHQLKVDAFVDDTQ
jgi:hypothetical protein